MAVGRNEVMSWAHQHSREKGNTGEQERQAKEHQLQENSKETKVSRMKLPLIVTTLEKSNREQVGERKYTYLSNGLKMNHPKHQPCGFHQPAHHLPNRICQ